MFIYPFVFTVGGGQLSNIDPLVLGKNSRSGQMLQFIGAFISWEYGVSAAV